MFTTFLINLDKDKDRLEFMSSQLNKINIPFERVAAVYGKTYSVDDREYNREKALAATGHALLPGEIGCALSHVSIYKMIVEKKLPYALVLEDDVELPMNFKEVIEKMVQQQAKIGFEYLLFDYGPVGFGFVKKWLKSVKVHVASKFRTSIFRGVSALVYALVKFLYIFPLSIFEGFRDFYKTKNPGPVIFLRPVYFAGAYLVTLRGAEKLLALAEPVIYTADQLPNRARVLKGLRFFCYSPRIVSQKNTIFGSSILELSAEEVQKLVS